VTSADPAAQGEYQESCSSNPEHGALIRHVLDRVAGKWSLLVIISLQSGPRRYLELKRHVIGVSQRMLTLTLRHLERDGLITRTIHAQVPPRVDYALTDLGRSLITPAQALAHWAIVNFPAIEAARERFDAAQGDGECELGTEAD
jgi:DNA-binding HxlR family transcriptional regulator